jgi:hypothetical protein
VKIREFLNLLQSSPASHVSVRLPDGSLVPKHFHITEVGHVKKRFIDCGGTHRIQETCLLQTWVHDDTEHRLEAGKLAAIFQRAGDILPHDELDVEMEHELDFVSQFPVESAEMKGDSLIFNLGVKHTDCLARGVCLPDSCAPKPPVALKIKTTAPTCAPGSGCC